MVQDNSTAQVQEDVPLSAPAAEAPPTDGVEPQVTAETEEAPPAPEAGEAAPEPTPWANEPDAYNVLAMDEFQPHLKRRDTRMAQQYAEQYKQDLEMATKGWESNQVNQTINALTGQLGLRLEEANFEGADRLLTKIERLREPYMEAHQKAFRNQGTQEAEGQLFGHLMNNLDMRGQDELNEAATASFNARKSRPDQWKDIIEKYGDLKQKGADDRAYTRLKGERDAAGAASQQVQQAREQGAVGALAPGSPTGGRSEKELLADPTTPVQTLIDIRARQNAG